MSENSIFMFNNWPKGRGADPLTHLAVILEAPQGQGLWLPQIPLLEACIAMPSALLRMPPFLPTVQCIREWGSAEERIEDILTSSLTHILQESTKQAFITSAVPPLLS